MNERFATLEKCPTRFTGKIPQFTTPLPDVTPDSLRPTTLETAFTIPSTWYTEPALHEWEREAIFARSWQYAGHISQVQEPGQYFLCEIGLNPVIVLRDKNGQLRAFYNVCRHRGGPLAYEDGQVSVLQCKYHGFTYDLDGCLKGTPEFQGVEGFCKEDYGLIPLLVDTWENFIFVHLSPEPEVPLHTVMEGIAERIAPYDLKALTFHKRVSYTVKSNWKVYIDNYLEGFHVPYVHPELTDVLDYRQYITEIYPWYSLQHSPLQRETDFYGTGGMVFYYFIYPNFILNILPNRLQLNVILPVTHDTCEVIFDYFYGEEGVDQARKDADEEFSNLVQDQDISICEAVQKGLYSRGYHQGRLSVKRESGVHHFQELIKDAYRRLAEKQSPDWYINA